MSGEMHMKRCSICKEEKNLEEFYRDRRHKTGRTNFCKDCRKRQNREYYRKYKSIAHEIYGGKCAWCGSVKELQLDHVHGGGAEHRRHYQVFAQIAQTGERLTDIALQLLCQPCHLKKTHYELPSKYPWLITQVERERAKRRVFARLRDRDRATYDAWFAQEVERVIAERGDGVVDRRRASWRSKAVE